MIENLMELIKKMKFHPKNGMRGQTKQETPFEAQRNHWMNLENLELEKMKRRSYKTMNIPY